MQNSFRLIYIWGGLTPPLFLTIITLWRLKKMEQAKLKELIAALENIVDMLKSEVYSDPSAYTQPLEISDYDEVFVEDDDGYPD